MKNPFNQENLANLNCVAKIDPHHLFKTHVKRAYWSFDQDIISLSSPSHQLIYYPSFLPFLNKKIHTESISFFLLHTPFLSLQNPNSIAFTPFLPTFEIWRSKPPSMLCHHQSSQRSKIKATIPSNLEIWRSKPPLKIEATIKALKEKEARCHFNHIFVSVF